MAFIPIRVAVTHSINAQSDFPSELNTKDISGITNQKKVMAPKTTQIKMVILSANNVIVSVRFIFMLFGCGYLYFNYD